MGSSSPVLAEVRSGYVAGLDVRETDGEANLADEEKVYLRMVSRRREAENWPSE